MLSNEVLVYVIVTATLSILVYGFIRDNQRQERTASNERHRLRIEVATLQLELRILNVEVSRLRMENDQLLKIIRQSRPSSEGGIWLHVGDTNTSEIGKSAQVGQVALGQQIQQVEES